MTRITLKGMRFHAIVGILPHEREVAQPIEVDLTVTVSEGTGIVDYARLYRAASGVLTSGAIDFLEQIADRVADAAFEVSERVTRVSVAVRKPHVPLGGPLDYAEVVIEREMDGEASSPDE
jgi:dihydroneopterin aldolase